MLVNLSVDARDHLTAGEVEAGVSALEAEIKARHREVSRVFIEIQAADRSEPGPPAASSIDSEAARSAVSA